MDSPSAALSVRISRSVMRGLLVIPAANPDVSIELLRMEFVADHTQEIRRDDELRADC
ncbi:hypothetical protein D3C73_1362040 [compost metagenome]